MDRVPEMSFCRPAHPFGGPYAVIENEHLKAGQKAEARFSLTGKYAIISGGSRGLGLTVAEGLLEHDAAGVALIDLDDEEGEKAARKLHAAFPDKHECILFRRVDVTEAEALGKTVHEIGNVFEKIDILVCFAGIVNSVRAIDYTPEAFRKICDVNTIGTFLTAQAVGREMISRKSGGSIILTASMAGHIVNYPQTHVAYGTSKAGVQHMTRCLAAEWAIHGIRVNSLSPGYMDTRLNASDDLVDVLQTWVDRTPQGRFGNKEELIGPVVLLASSAGSFMTGSDLQVDGGYTLF